jgi:hypothetical protein
VFITVAGEPVELVAETVAAAKRMDYPAFAIHILNDGYVAKKDNWRDIEALASRMDVHCITRTVAGGAKAGNINNALRLTTLPLIAIFDADHVPHRDFLRKTVGYFANERVGFVQTPQFYKNYGENFLTRSTWEQQELFFGPICKGKNRLNAATMCGTNMVISRKALNEVGGMCTDSIAEDFVTGLFMHARGWKSVYVPEVLAEGLATEDLLSYTKQQFRWARGALDVLFRYNPLRYRGLTWAQRIQYIASASFYVSGLVVLFDILLPLVFFYTGAVPVLAPGMLLAAVFLPYMFCTLYTIQRTSNCFRLTAFTTPPPTGDTTAPTVSVSAPSTATVGTAISLTANASDNVGVAGVQFRINGSSQGSEDTSSPYSLSYTPTSAGTLTVSAVARDAAGNNTTSNSVSVTVSSAPPTQVCGNNIVESGEVCDGSQLAGQSCFTQGYTGGNLLCNGACSGYVTTSCTNTTPTPQGNNECTDGSDNDGDGRTDSNDTGCTADINNLTERLEAPIGMNTEHGVRFFASETVITFKDVFNGSALTGQINGTGYPQVWASYLQSNTSSAQPTVIVPTDRNGYPTQIPYDPDGAGGQAPVVVRTTFNRNPYAPTGSYTISFDGTGTVRVGSTDCVGTGGTTNCSVSITPTWSGTNLFILQSSASDPIRRIAVVTPNNASTYRTQPFYTPFVDMYRNFSVIRFMELMQTNHYPCDNAPAVADPSSDPTCVTTWAGRVLPNQIQSTHKGIAWEYAVDLANTVGADMWINVPHAANDEYVRELARLILGRLDRNRKVYVELSNEAWNGSFAQTRYFRNVGTARGYTGGTDVAGRKAYALRLSQVINIFNTEFGSQQNRLVRVLGAQLGAPYVASDLLSHWATATYNPSGSTLDAIAVNPYFGRTVTAADTVTGVLDYGQTFIDTQIIPALRDYRDLPTRGGRRIIAYEGGQHFLSDQSAGATATLLSANRNSRMGDLTRRLLDGWYANGGDLFMYFNSIRFPDQYGAFGAVEYLGQSPNPPKYQSLLDKITQLLGSIVTPPPPPPPPPTSGGTTQTLFTSMGGSALPNTATTIYSALTGNGGNDLWMTNTTETNAGSVLPAGTLNSFRFTSTYDTNLYDVGDAGDNIIATVMKNGVATSLTCTVTGAAGTGASGQEQCGTVPVVANPPITVSAGDRFTVRIQMQGTPTNPGGAAWSVDFTPSTSNTTVMAGSFNTGNSSARYLPPGVSTYTANFGIGANTDADGRVIVPIAGNITGIICRSNTSRTASVKTEVYVNGSVVGALDCTVPANSTNPVIVNATRALSVGDTVSLKYNNGGSGMIFATLLFAPTNSGKWWGGFSSGPAVTWGQYTYVSPLTGYGRTTCTWNGTCDTWPPPHINIDSMRVDLGTVPTGAQTLAVSVARHIEDPPGLNSAIASSLRCSFASGSSNTCTVNGPVSVDAVNNNDYWELWLNHTNTPNPSTLKVSTVYSSDLVTGGTTPPPPTGGTVNQITIIPAIEGTTPTARLFTVTISTPGASTPLVSQNVTAVGNSLTVTGLSLTPATYDIRIRANGYLMRRVTQALTNNATVSFSNLPAGDLNNDGVINSMDWSVMSGQWNTNNSTSDVNGDGVVNSIDFSFLNKNWGQTAQ